MKALPSPKKLFIPKVDDCSDFDVCERKYRNCIINTLINVKAKYIFEIGTFLFQTSNAISYYINKYQTDGKLITADISVWNRKETPSAVYPIMFFPYVDNPAKEHGDMCVYYEKFKEVVRRELSLEFNIVKLVDEMLRLNIDKFDLAFVDGAHNKISFLNDLYIAKLVTRQNGYILIDDIYKRENDPDYDQYKIYKELKRHNNFYEFEDWGINPNMALIQCKHFKVNI